MSKNTRVSILFPPPMVVPSSPPLAPALLVGYLRERNIEARSIDMNLEFYRWVAEPGGPLQTYLDFKIGRFKEIQAAEKADAKQIGELRGLLPTLSLLPPEYLDHRLKGLDDPAPGQEELLAEPTTLITRFGSETNIFVQLTVEEAVEKHQGGEFHWIWDRFYKSDLLDELISKAADAEIVGISVPFIQQLYHALVLAKRVRQHNKTAKIILGGPQMALMNDDERLQIASLDSIDALVLHDGEVPLTAITEAMSADKDLSTVPGIAFANADGKLIKTELPDPLHPDQEATPWFYDEELPRYFPGGASPFLTNRSRAYLPVHVTRGCYWGRCTFCDYNNLLNPKQKRYLERSAEKVTEDIRTLQRRHGIFSFALVSDSLPPRWIRKFCDQVKRSKVEGRYWAFLRNEGKGLLNHKLLAAMKSAGLEEITCGTESVSERLLKVIDKGTTPQDIDDNFHMFAIAGIRAQLNMIPDYPTATEQEVLEGMQYLLDRKDAVPGINPQPFDLSAHSRIAKDPERYGIEIPKPNEALPGTNRYRSLGFRRLEGLTDGQRMKLAVPFLTLLDEHALYHQTVHCRERLEARGFRWRGSRLSFCSFVEIPSDISLQENGKRKSVIFLIPLDGPARLLEISTQMEALVELFRKEVGMAVPFEVFLEAYSQDALRMQPGLSPTFLESSCIGLLRNLVYEGIVNNVFGGPCLEAAQPVLNALEQQNPASKGLSVVNTGIASDPVKMITALNRL